MICRDSNTIAQQEACQPRWHGICSPPPPPPPPRRGGGGGGGIPLGYPIVLWKLEARQAFSQKKSHFFRRFSLTVVWFVKRKVQADAKKYLKKYLKKD